MKSCNYCRISVGGDLRKCPFCQSKLVGTDENRYFPKPTALKISSFLYKLQMFIVWTVIIGLLGTEFILKIKFFDDFYVSLIATAWLLVFEFGIMGLFKRRTNPARVVTLMAFFLSLLLLGTSYFVGYYKLVCDMVVPIIVMGTLVTNFVLVLIDRASSGMVYLLISVLFCIIPYGYCSASHKSVSFCWSIGLMLGVILFIGAIIFRGRAVSLEIKKRFNV